jgi:hypothetical protein
VTTQDLAPTDPGWALAAITELLERDDPTTVNTSMRIPTALRDAAALAVGALGLAPSTTALAADALRATLEAAVVRAALDEHYEQFPASRPDLADLALAAARLDGHPLAAERARLRQAAEEVVEHHGDATPADVVLWAEARAFATTPRP